MTLAKIQQTEIKVSPDSLLFEAVQKNVSVETIERILAMRRELSLEHAEQAFNDAFASLQSELPIITKSKAVKNKNGSVRYSYAPIEELVKILKPYLSKHGFNYRFECAQSDSVVVATCYLTHSLGASRHSSFPAPVDPEAFMNDSQKVASANSYAKRNAFKNVLGLVEADEDDDAQAVGQGTTPDDLYSQFRMLTAAIMRNIDSIQGIKACLATDDFEGAAQIYEEIPDDELKKIWVAPSKGGPFTSEERALLKEKVSPIVQTIRGTAND